MDYPWVQLFGAERGGDIRSLEVGYYVIGYLCLGETII